MNKFSLIFAVQNKFVGLLLFVIYWFIFLEFFLFLIFNGTYSLSLYRHVAKLWRGYLAPCGEVTKAVARLLSLLWRGYQICGEITCCEVTLWRGYSQVTGDSPIFRWNQQHLTLF